MSEPSPEELAALRNHEDFDLEPPKPAPRSATTTSTTTRTEHPRRSYAPDPHRLLPQSPDGEKGVLSSILISFRECMGFVHDRGVTADWFAMPSHQEIFRALCELDSSGENVDFIVLTQYLRDRGRLDQAGGAAFITDLFTFLPTAANIGYYVEVLDEKRQLREAIQVCTEVASRCYDEQDMVDEIMDKFEAGALRVRQSRFGKVNLKTPKQLVIETITAIQELYDRRGAVSGVPTGFPELDKLTDGLGGNRQIIIAARPSVGKTAFALNIAENIATDSPKCGIVIFSLEMSAQQLMQRLLCSRARVNAARVRDGYLSERDFPSLQTAASFFGALDSRLVIDDFTEATVQYIRAKARRYRQSFEQRGLEHMVVITDYLQLVSSSSKRSAFSRELEVAEVSRGLKLMAKELNITSIALAQLNRDLEKSVGRKGPRRPRLSDLRESGSIEQDADDVWFLTRDEMHAQNDDEREELTGRANLIVAKQRSGPLGDVPLTFLKEFTRFEPRAYDADDDAPRRPKPQTRPQPKIESPRPTDADELKLA